MYMHVGYFYNMHVFCAVMLKYGLLTKCEVKMAGYSPGSFLVKKNEGSPERARWLHLAL